MKVFTTKDFIGHWVGTAAVVVAADEISARLALCAELDRLGLEGTFTLQELDPTSPRVLILQDGDY